MITLMIIGFVVKTVRDKKLKKAQRLAGLAF
jgi:hypothetical protein